MTTYTHGDFFRAFLDGLGLANRISGLRTLAGVSIFESSQGRLRWFNPLACTLPYNGSTPLYPNYQGACAQVYKTFDDGVAASVRMWQGPHWAAVRQAHVDYYYRIQIMPVWSAAYTWVNPRPYFDHDTAILDARIAQQLT